MNEVVIIPMALGITFAFAANSPLTLLRCYFPCFRCLWIFTFYDPFQDQAYLFERAAFQQGIRSDLMALPREEDTLSGL